MNSIPNNRIKFLRILLCVLCAVTLFFVFTLDTSFGAVKFKRTRVTGVKVKVGEEQTAIVSWARKSGAAGYVIYVSANKKTGYRAAVSVRASSKAMARVGKLAVGKTYYIKVRAYGKKGKKRVYGKYSRPIKHTVPPSLTVNAVKKTTSRMRISFTGSKQVGGFLLYRSAQGGPFRKIRELPASARSYVDQGLKDDQVYRYRIRAWAKGKKTCSAYSLVDGDRAGGNSRQYDLGRIALERNKLNGKRIAFLGSSITQGHSSGGISFVEYLVKRDGIAAEKYSVGGTTISYVSPGDRSYVERIGQIPASRSRDLLVCQLSTNDTRLAEQEMTQPPEEADSSSGEDDMTPDEILVRMRQEALDAETGKVEMGLKYIIAYSNLKLNCPAAFYIVPPYQNAGTARYGEMITALYDTKKWAEERNYRVYILDLWSDPGFASFHTHNEERSFYMRDSVHPTRAGYLDKFVPAFERFLKGIL